MTTSRQMLQTISILTGMYFSSRCNSTILPNLQNPINLDLLFLIVYFDPIGNRRCLKIRNIIFQQPIDCHHAILSIFPYIYWLKTHTRVYVSCCRSFYTWDTSSFKWSTRFNCANSTNENFSGGGWWFRSTSYCSRSTCFRHCGFINLNAKVPYYKGYKNITYVSMKLRLDEPILT